MVDSKDTSEPLRLQPHTMTDLQISELRKSCSFAACGAEAVGGK